MSLTVDHQRTRAADALATVVVEYDCFVTLLYEAFVQDVEHLKKRCFIGDFVDDVRVEPTRTIRAILTPDFQGQILEGGAHL
jgi:hypothetical protein